MVLNGVQLEKELLAVYFLLKAAFRNDLLKNIFMRDIEMWIKENWPYFAVFCSVYFWSLWFVVLFIFAEKRMIGFEIFFDRSNIWMRGLFDCNIVEIDSLWCFPWKFENKRLNWIINFAHVFSVTFYRFCGLRTSKFWYIWMFCISYLLEILSMP